MCAPYFYNHILAYITFSNIPNCCCYYILGINFSNISDNSSAVGRFHLLQRLFQASGPNTRSIKLNRWEGVLICGNIETRRWQTRTVVLSWLVVWVGPLASIYLTNVLDSDPDFVHVQGFACQHLVPTPSMSISGAFAMPTSLMPYIGIRYRENCLPLWSWVVR